MLGLYQPMSSPQMTRMLGFLAPACACAGTLAPARDAMTRAPAASARPHIFFITYSFWKNRGDCREQRDACPLHLGPTGDAERLLPNPRQHHVEGLVELTLAGPGPAEAAVPGPLHVREAVQLGLVLVGHVDGRGPVHEDAGGLVEQRARGRGPEGRPSRPGHV